MQGKDINIHIHVDEETPGALKEILDRLCSVESAFGELSSKVEALSEKVTKMAGELERLTTEVEENTSAIQSAITLLETLSELIRQNAGNPAALNALADSLDANSNSLAAAVAANTPAEEPLPEELLPPTATDTEGGQTG